MTPYITKLLTQKHFFINFFFVIYIMEHPTSNNNIKAIKDIRKLFNEPRSNLFNNEAKSIRRKLYKKKQLVGFLKKKSKMVL